MRLPCFHLRSLLSHDNCIQWWWIFIWRSFFSSSHCFFFLASFTLFFLSSTACVCVFLRVSFFLSFNSCCLLHGIILMQSFSSFHALVCCTCLCFSLRFLLSFHTFLCLFEMIQDIGKSARLILLHIFGCVCVFWSFFGLFIRGTLSVAENENRQTMRGHTKDVEWWKKM